MYLNEHGVKIYGIDESIRDLFDHFGLAWASTPECSEVILREDVYRLRKQRLLEYGHYTEARPHARAGGKIASYWRLTDKGIRRLMRKWADDIKIPAEAKVRVAKIILRTNSE